MMLKNIFRAGAFLLALALAPLVSVSAKGHKRHRHGRGRVDRQVVRTHYDNSNPTPGIPRRVRRGQNMTPGIPRGSLSVRTPSTFPTDEARRLGRTVERRQDRGVVVGTRGRRHGKH